MIKRRAIFSIAALAFASFFAVSPASAVPMNKLFFLHHSTGQNLINQGGVREWLEDYNAQNGSNFAFWDHDYNYIGLRRADGSYVGWIYNIPNDNTDPIGLYTLWTTANAARDSILQNHEVIAFKSCYPASAITTTQMLQQYQTWYLAIRDVFDQHPERTFVVMSPPPLHRLATDLTQADNARAFANWLKSAEFLQGHTNIVCFDLFDALAAPDTPDEPTRNMLRYEYEISHITNDSHPNTVANVSVGPLFAAALVAAAELKNITAVPSLSRTRPTLSIHPNPFNPAAVVAFELAAETTVTLSVFDLRGHLVRTLAHDQRKAGAYRERWDGRDDRGQDSPAGVYLCRLQTDDATVVSRMALVR
jgi:hypothetical protein